MRPPKSVRARLREAGEWSTPQPTPPRFSLIDEFALGSDQPQPVPGSYSPVFSFSQEYEERTAEFTLSPDLFLKLFDTVERSVHSDCSLDDKLRACGLTASGFTARLFSSACIALASHLARIRQLSGHDLQGMSMFPTLMLPVCVSDYIRSIGEFTGVDGKRWYLRDFASTVKSLVRAADSISSGDDFRVHLARLWLPTGTDDGNTAFVVAHRLHAWFLVRGFHVSVEELLPHVFKGSIPPCVSVHFSELGIGQSKLVARLFETYSDERHFFNMFSDMVGVAALSEFDLSLGQAEPRDLQFSMKTCRVASRVHKLWYQSQLRYMRLLGVAFSHSEVPSTRGGSQLIASSVQSIDSEHVVKSVYCLPDEDIAMLACYGAPALLSDPFRFTRVGILPAGEQLASIVSYDLGYG